MSRQYDPGPLAPFAAAVLGVITVVLMGALLIGGYAPHLLRIVSGGQW